MILDKIKKLKTYADINKRFKKAHKFLKREDIDKLPDGRYEIDGKKVYAIVMRGNAKPQENAKAEAHNRYIDIQAVIAGTELMGWKPRSECKFVEQKYNKEKDVELYKDKIETWVRVDAGCMAVFFPDDVHAPMVGNGTIHKVVVKVRL